MDMKHIELPRQIGHNQVRKLERHELPKAEFPYSVVRQETDSPETPTIKLPGCLGLAPGNPRSPMRDEMPPCPEPLHKLDSHAACTTTPDSISLAEHGNTNRHITLWTTTCSAEKATLAP